MFFPSESAGWTAQGLEERYGPDTLNQYIDGASEVYLAFGVREVRARRYSHPQGGEILADVFDMGSSENSFGAYHHDLREGVPLGVGRESERGDTTAAFWKGRHYVSLTALQDNAATRQGLLDLARQIALGLPDEGGPPALVGLLPQEGLIPSRIHFLKDFHLLNRHFFLADDDVLGLAAGAQAVLAAYRPLGSKPETGAYRLLLVQYPSPQEARAVEDRLKKTLLHDADAAGIARWEDSMWAGLRRAGVFLAAVFDAPERDIAEKSLETAVNTLKTGKGGRP